MTIYNEQMLIKLTDINSSLKEIRDELQWFKVDAVDKLEKLDDLDWTVKSSTASRILESLDEIKSKLERLDEIERKLER